MASRYENPRHFPQRAGPRFHVAQPKGHGERIERAIRKGKAERVGRHRAAQTLAAGDVEHRLAEIRARDLGAGAGALDCQSEIAAAGCEIKQGRGFPPADDARGAAAPEKIESAGEQVICEIVPAGDR